jgi:DNA topoisomerase-1
MMQRAPTIHGGCTLPRRTASRSTAQHAPEPARSAVAAGLRHVSDAAPGITRRRAGRGFTYTGPDGKTVRDRATLARIRALAIPPAWTEVWIAPDPRGHIQATGRDARRRKQYRYHPSWHEVRHETKFGRMLAFSAALPKIRRALDADLALSGLPRRKVLATVVRLLETTRIRVGNQEYARANDSFGLTTLRTRQVRVNGSTMSFRFRGKSGVQHDVALNDRKLATIVRRMRDLPGYELFQYVDEAGERRAVDSADVNEYLRSAAGEEFTSKDFRTWAGTVLAAQALHQCGKNQLKQAIARVARQLGNTPAVCRKCYIHPAVIDAYLEDRLTQTMNGGRAELCVRKLLQQRPRKKSDSLVPALKQSLRRLRRHRGTQVAALSRIQ